MSVYFLIFLLSCVKLSFGYFITVDAHAEECFFDRVQTGTKMVSSRENVTETEKKCCWLMEIRQTKSLMFQIAEGGFLDIDIKIVGPDGNIIHQGERETNGKYTFQANMEGIYTYCFSNKMSTMTPKIVLFNMEIDEPTKDETGDKEVNHNKIDEMIKTLSTTLTGVKHEQDYMRVRDRIHREINESTNSRVVLWSIFEAFVLVVMTIGQIYYLKRFFEVRRVV